MRARSLFAVPSFLLGLGFALGPMGCGGGPKVEATTVGQEELFKTGNFNYDEYFEDLYGYQASAHHAVEDEHSARLALGRALGVGEASLDRMLEQLTIAVDEHAQGKAHVRFTIDGVDEQGAPIAGKKIMVTSAAKGRALPKDAAELTLAIDQAAKAEAQVWEKYGPLPDKGNRLSAKASELDGDVKSTFASEPDAKRDRVRKELAAAKTVSTELAQRTEKVVKAATRFLQQTGEIFVAAATSDAKAGKAAPKGKAPPAVKAREPSKPVVPKSSSAPAAKSDKPKPSAGGEGSTDFNP